MNLKLEVVKALLYFLLGIFAAGLIEPEVDNTPKPIVETKQSQTQQCKVIQIIKQDAKGNSIQTLEISANDLQEQGTKIAPSPSLATKLGLGISAFTDKSLAVRYELTNNFSLIGKCDNLSEPKRLDAGIELRF